MTKTKIKNCQPKKISNIRDRIKCNEIREFKTILAEEILNVRDLIKGNNEKRNNKLLTKEISNVRDHIMRKESLKQFWLKNYMLLLY